MDKWETIDDMPTSIKDWVESVKGDKLHPDELKFAQELIEGYHAYIQDEQNETTLVWESKQRLRAALNKQEIKSCQ